jgi:AcrR family transcriptional regulator
VNSAATQSGTLRRQRPRGSITREAVVSAALAVIDKVGIDRLTIRAVAKLAAAPPMSLYTHFTNKNELLDFVYTEVWRRLYPDELPSVNWSAGLLALCGHVRNLLIEHPRWIPLLAQPASPPGVPGRERILKEMVQAGMAPGAAMAALTSAMLTTIGLALVEVTLRAPDGREGITKRYERLRVWAEESRGDDHPVTRKALSKHRHLNLEENFLLVVRSLIAGFEANQKLTTTR